MRFVHSHYAYAFWLVLVIVLFFTLVYRNKKAAMRKFAKGATLREISLSVNFKRQIIKAIIFIFALSLCVLSLMRPQWGFKWQEVKRKGLDILIAIDTSKSMLATDVKPNRLERSKLAVRDLVKKLKGDRIGLIAFAGTAYLQCPLTIDYGGFLLALNDISASTIPRGGTSISSAISVALKGKGVHPKEDKALIIITDGEDHEGDPEKTAQKANTEGVRIFCVGIGTKEGDLIQVVDEYGKRVFLKDEAGNMVKSRLNEDALRKIAFITGGTYVRSSGAEFGLDLIYDERLSRMEKKEIKAEMSKVYYERFQIPLWIALMLLFIEPFISDRKKA